MTWWRYSMPTHLTLWVWRHRASMWNISLLLYRIGERSWVEWMLLLMSGLKCRRIGVFWSTSLSVQRISDNSYHRTLKCLRLCMGSLLRWWLQPMKILSLSITAPKEERLHWWKCLKKSKNAKKHWMIISNRKRKSSLDSISCPTSPYLLSFQMARTLLKCVSS